MYSGYIFEELSDKDNKSCHVKDIMDKDNDNDVTDSILSMLDILVDGEFQIDKKDITLHFRGSSNQRIIDVPMSLKKGSVVLATKYM